MALYELFRCDSVYSGRGPIHDIAASPVHSAYRAFFAIRVFLLSLGSALVFFDGVSVGIGITSVSLSVAYSPEDTRNSGMI